MPWIQYCGAYVQAEGMLGEQNIDIFVTRVRVSISDAFAFYSPKKALIDVLRVSVPIRTFAIPCYNVVGSQV